MVIRSIACILSILLLGFIRLSEAQDAKISGIVSDRQTGIPLEMANVMLQNLSEQEHTGSTTDSNGLYKFNKLALGDYVLTIRYLGYKTYVDTLTISEGGEGLLKNVQLYRSSKTLDEIVVSDRSPNAGVGHIRIDNEELKKALTPAASADLASYLQSQPGVVSTGDRGGQLFIRGGTPGENLVLVDGATIYQPFHILGFFSVFSEEEVSEVDLYAGGFSAKYKGRTSSVMDVRLQNGNLYDQGWSASISPFVSGIHYETPIKEGKSSLMFSGRASLIQKSSSLYLKKQQPIRFNNQLIKFSNIGDRVSCSTFFMRTYDRGKIDFQEDEFFKWNNAVLSGRCFGGIEGASVSFVDMNISFSHFSNEVGDLNEKGRYSKVFKTHVDVSLVQHIGDLRLDYSFFTDFRNLNYDISERFLFGDKSRTTLLSTGGDLTMKLPLGDKFSLDPGIVVTSYIGKNISVEPRLQWSWHPRDKLSEELHGALGVYKQRLLGISDFRDAGTAFTAWVTMPESNRIMEAKHALVGWRQPIGDRIDISLEGYYKDLGNIPVSVWSAVAQFTTDLAYADGFSYGADLKLEINSKKAYLSIGYGYSLTEYETAQDHFSKWFGESVQAYNPSHDRRHQLNINAGFETSNYTANVNWVFGSGLPFTRPLGFDSFAEFKTRTPDVTKDYGKPRILMDKPFQGRLPNYHRLDISVEKEISFQSVTMKVQAGVINAYDVQNLFYYDVFEQRGIQQLSFMPYFSLKIGSQ